MDDLARKIDKILLLRNKYIFARILFIFSQIAGFGIDTVQMLNPEVDKHQAIISPA